MGGCKVFIVCKQRDESGRRTTDYVFADDLYVELFNRGVSVALSESMSSKSGQSDYIKDMQNILDTARILVVVGSRREYLSSIDVEYAYESFSGDIQKGKKQNAHIVCCMKDIPINEVPKSLVLCHNIPLVSDDCKGAADYIVNLLDKSDSDKAVSVESEELKYANTLEYFENNMKHISEIESVEMAFHGGAEWHRVARYNDTLHKLARNNIKINILVNTPAMAKRVADHMKHEGTKDEYLSFNKGLEKWKKFAKDYPEQAEVRTINIPILRCYHSFHMKTQEKDTVHVRHYTYANTITDKNLQNWFARNTEYFDLYRNEFEYLWEHAEAVKGK